ncbi:MAG: 3-oxoadipate enol-lactonase [Geminicoccaceae bacterium]|nr:3-oxoadipate enol-lactonase [Geminicoccaceae bacterium]MCB9944890.1 3-oxoadipate enol-lactonase [Geminicoccaceae bacterium]
MAFTSPDGWTVHFEHRAGTGRPIVLANSLGTDFRVWDGLLPMLPGGHPILRYDKRGHGLSDLVDRPLTIDGLADDLASLMDERGVKGALVIGLSIGGMIAQSLAARRRDLVEAVVLMDTAHRIGTPEMWEQRIATVRRDGLEPMVQTILERWFTPVFHAARKADLAGWRNMVTRTSAEGYVRCCEAIRDADLTRSTRALQLPALCLVGREDGSTPVGLVEELSSLIEGAQFGIIDGAGHLPCVEQPEATAALVNRFIKDRLG